MLLLHDPIQAYAWGAVDGLAPLVGTEPTGGPEAELWVGAHQAAPSVLAEEPTRTLAAEIAADPTGRLGAEVVAAFGPELPFLLKVLAIGAPLSLQAHPSPEQAERGFAREEAAGIPRDALERTYRDGSAKPELLVALVDTWALCGFRPPAEARRLVEALQVRQLRPLQVALESDGSRATRTAMEWLLGLAEADRSAIAVGVFDAVATAGVDPHDRSDPRAWVARLAAEHPGDPACVAPLLLNLLHLAPGEAVHLPAGNLHAYLEGAGVELMAASDNVLRGGLTSKHVDVDELLEVLTFEPGLPAPVPPEHPAAGVTTYDAGEAAFRLAAIRPDQAGGTVVLPLAGPALLLSTGGDATVRIGHDELHLGGGRAVFVSAGEGPVEVAGAATVWQATTGGPHLS
ncbi:MAG: Mannose-6-phosphate isomerase [Acidimicrobiales bacterium]|nr:Mannose-6-phosphate isomerase [Acidimicrobiales bacterium]